MTHAAHTISTAAGEPGDHHTATSTVSNAILVEAPPKAGCLTLTATCEVKGAHISASGHRGRVCNKVAVFELGRQWCTVLNVEESVRRQWSNGESNSAASSRTGGGTQVLGRSLAANLLLDDQLAMESELSLRAFTARWR